MKTKLLLAVMALSFVACTSNYRTLPMDEFEKAIKQPNVVVVDVRTPQEYAEGHIAGAINIDWKAGNFAEQADELLDDDKTIALYCIHAKRSKLAAETLQKMEYEDIIELQDGLEVWINAGKPIEKTVSKTIPYSEAKNYFVRNDAQLPVPAKINTREEFDGFFGMAATMGDDGMPTSIDFTKQFVIAVVLPATNVDLELDDERLVDNGESLIFEYSVDKDDEVNSWTQTPLLLIVVDRQYERENVLLKGVADL